MYLERLDESRGEKRIKQSQLAPSRAQIMTINMVLPFLLLIYYFESSCQEDSPLRYHYGQGNRLKEAKAEIRRLEWENLLRVV